MIEKHIQGAILVQRYVEDVLNRGDLALVDDLFAPDFVAPRTIPRIAPGPPGMRALLTAWRTAFPDLTVVIEDLIEANDRVIYRWTLHGTHRHDFAGIPASNREIATSGIGIFTVRDGRLADLHQSWDQTGLVHELLGQRELASPTEELERMADLGGSSYTEATMPDLCAALNLVDAGTFPQDDVVPLFQALLDTGMIYHLTDRIQRVAAGLVEDGLCITPKTEE